MGPRRRGAEALREVRRPLRPHLGSLSPSCELLIVSPLTAPLREGTAYDSFTFYIVCMHVYEGVHTYDVAHRMFDDVHLCSTRLYVERLIV